MVKFKIPIGEMGTLTLETSAPHLVRLHGDPESRNRLMTYLAGISSIVVGAALVPDDGKSLDELSRLVDIFAGRTIERLKHDRSN